MGTLQSLGRLLSVFALGLFLIGFVYESPLLYLLAFVCIAAMLAASAFAELACRDLACQREITSTVIYSGDPVSETIRLTERIRRWRPLEIRDIAVNAVTGETIHREMHIMLMPSRITTEVLVCGGHADMQEEGPSRAATVVVHGEIIFPRRGQYLLGPLTVAASDPLGIRYVPRTFGEVHQIIVYPRPLAIKERTMVHISDDPGQISVRSVRPVREGCDFHGVRPYVQGDDIRRIHWKVTAHTGRPSVKEFDQPQRGGLSIILDLQQLFHQGEGDHSTLEAGVTLAATLAHHMLDVGQGVSLILSGQQPMSLPMDHGERQRRKIFDALALAKDDGALPLSQILENTAYQRNSARTVIVITPNPDRLLLGALSHYHRTCKQLVLVVLEAEAFHHVSCEKKSTLKRQLSLLRRHVEREPQEGPSSLRDASPATSRGGIETFTVRPDTRLEQIARDIWLLALR